LTLSDDEAVEPTAQIVQQSDRPGQWPLLIPSPLPVPAGGPYALRLVVSDEKEGPDFWKDNEPDWTPERGTVLQFSTTPFEVDVVPTGGSCAITPAEGEVTMTQFEISTSGWTDDDLPLQYRFSWFSGATTETGGKNWNILSAWKTKMVQSSILFKTAGKVSARAEARDAYGSISASLAQANVIIPDTAPSEDELNALLDAILASGDPMATMGAIGAMAGAGGDEPPSAEFQNKMLDAMSSPTMLAEPSVEVVGMMTGALGGVISAAAGTGGRRLSDANATVKPRALDPDVAGKSTGLITNVAGAAGSLDDGLDEDTGGQLVGSVGTLFASTEPSDEERRLNQVGANATNPKKELAANLMTATGSIGDALVAATPVGTPVAINSSTGLSLAAMTQDPDELANSGASVGGFSLPPMPGVVRRLREMRRLQGGECTDSNGRRLSEGGVGLQQTAWPTNPFSQGAGADNIADDAIQSMDVKSCGQTVSVENLSEPVRFTLKIPFEGNGTDTRVCQYYDEVNENWTDYGCSAENTSTREELHCACNHLSTFGGMFGALLDAFGSALMCSNADILSADGLSRIAKGTWWYEPGALVVFSFVFTFVGILVMAIRLDKKNAAGTGVHSPWNDEMFFTTDNGCVPPKESLRDLLFGEDGTLMVLKDEIQAAMRLAKTRHSVIGILVHKAFVVANLKVTRVQASQTLGMDEKDFRLMKKMTKKRDKISKKKANILKRQNSKELQMPDGTGSIESLGESSQQVGDQSMGLQSADSHCHHQQAFNDRVSNVNNAFVFQAVARKNGEGTVGALWGKALHATHPVGQVTQFSMISPRSIRAVLLWAKVFGAMMVSALFFGSTAKDASADPECTPGSPMEALMMTIVVGILSSMLSAIPLFIMGMLHRRDFIHVPSLDDPIVAKTLAGWRSKDKVLWLLASCYIAFTILFLLAFLANASTFDATTWLMSAAISILKEVVLVPIFISFVLAIISMSLAQIPDVTDVTIEKITGKKPQPKEMLDALDGTVMSAAIDIDMPVDEEMPTVRTMEQMAPRLDIRGDVKGPQGIVVGRNLEETWPTASEVTSTPRVIRLTPAADGSSFSFSLPVSNFSGQQAGSVASNSTSSRMWQFEDSLRMGNAREPHRNALSSGAMQASPRIPASPRILQMQQDSRSGMAQSRQDSRSGMAQSRQDSRGGNSLMPGNLDPQGSSARLGSPRWDGPARPSLSMALAMNVVEGAKSPRQEAGFRFPQA
jgi:hypothetical protein